MSKLKIRQIRSTIGSTERQKRTIKGLGLGRINKEVIKPNTTSIRGMVTKVQHLVCVSAEKDA